MRCNKCGYENNPTAKFCVSCGSQLDNVSLQLNIEDLSSDTNYVNNQNTYEQPMTNVSFETQQAYNPANDFVQQQNSENSSNVNNNFQSSGYVQDEPMQKFTVNEFNNQNVQQGTCDESAGRVNFIVIIFGILLKPISTMKTELSKFNNIKTSILFALIMVGVTTIISLIKFIIASVYVPASEGFFGYGATEAKWDWNLLKDANIFEYVFKIFFIYAGIIVGVALVYYLASLIIKKRANFKKLLGITSISIIPFVLCGLVISPLIAKLYAPLGIVFTVMGAVYTILILIDGVNRELSFEDNDVKIYTNLVCLSIVGCAIYYIFMKFFLISSISNQLNNFLDIFH